jgi:hypothetical protein
LGFVSGQTLFDQALDEIFKMNFSVLWNILAFLTEFFLNVFERVVAVKAFPDEYTHRIETKGVARVRIKKNSPIVEFFSKDYHWIGYRCTFVFHELARSFKVFKFL